MKKGLKVFTNGIIAENPVLRLVLGTCPTLAVTTAAVNGIGMGIGFTVTLTVMGAIRELIGAGTIFGFTVTANLIPPMLIMILPPGGFFVFGILVALSNKLAVKKGKEPKQELGCGAGCIDCPFNNKEVQ